MKNVLTGAFRSVFNMSYRETLPGSDSMVQGTVLVKHFCWVEIFISNRILSSWSLGNAGSNKVRQVSPLPDSLKHSLPSEFVSPGEREHSAFPKLLGSLLCLDPCRFCVLWNMYWKMLVWWKGTKDGGYPGSRWVFEGFHRLYLLGRSLNCTGHSLSALK